MKIVILTIKQAEELLKTKRPTNFTIPEIKFDVEEVTRKVIEKLKNS